MKRLLWPAAWQRHERPTSPAVESGGLVFFSGQTGTDLERGEVVGESPYEQALQAVRNIETLLAEAGGSLDDVVKTTVFVADMTDVPEINRAYGELMPKPFPARSAVQAGLARAELKVEIEGIAVLTRSGDAPA